VNEGMVVSDELTITNVILAVAHLGAPGVVKEVHFY